MAASVNNKKDLIVQLELMYSNKIFTREEIKNIIKKRIELETKLKKDDKTKMDHANLIKFETGVYHEVKKRRERLSITKDVDKIDLSLAQYICTLYKNTLQCYPGNIGIWVAFIKYSVGMGFLDAVTQTFAKILDSYTAKAQLWHIAAKWEREQNQSITKALDYSMRAIKYHPKNVLLLAEAYDFTLLKASGEDKDLSDAEKLYKSAVKEVDDIEFVLGLLNVTERYDFAESLQKKIIDDVKLLHPQKEIVFNAIAQNAVRGKNSLKISSTEKLQSCIAIYKQAIKDMPTEKMWCYYIDHLLTLNKDKEVFLTDERKAVMAALNEAHGLGMLNAHQYLEWLRILDAEGGHEKEMADLVVQVISKNFTSIELWKSLVYYYIVDEKPEKVRQTFDQAVKVLGEDSFPLWNLMIMYHLSRPDNSEESIRNIFLEAIQQPEKISQFIKPKYLEYLVITKNITFARNAYKALATRKPYCLKLHTTMELLERVQIDPDVTQWRKCHENATNLFGQNNKDLWINYIKFEKTNGDPLRVPIVYTKAKENLDATLIDDFETEYIEVLNTVEEELEI